MTRLAGGEPSIEGGRGDAHIGAALGRHDDALAVADEEAGVGEGLKLVDFGGKARRAAESAEVEFEIAHQPLDHRATHAVVFGEGQSFHDRELARGQRARVAAEVRRVLDKALRQLADGAGAEADQRVGFVDRVALEIAAQALLTRGEGKRIGGQGEMSSGVINNLT